MPWNLLQFYILQFLNIVLIRSTKIGSEQRSLLTTWRTVIVHLKLKAEPEKGVIFTCSYIICNVVRISFRPKYNAYIYNTENACNYFSFRIFFFFRIAVRRRRGSCIHEKRLGFHFRRIFCCVSPVGN
jgi:hypothetical protein